MEEEIAKLGIPSDFPPMDFNTENALESVYKCFEKLKKKYEELDQRISNYDPDNDFNRTCKETAIRTEKEFKEIKDSTALLKKYEERKDEKTAELLKEENAKTE